MHGLHGLHGLHALHGHFALEGGVASALLAINGLRWSIATDGKKIQIGCQCHAVADWDAFDDERIAAMHGDALAFWREFKPTIMAMARYRATKDE